VSLPGRLLPGDDVAHAASFRRLAFSRQAKTFARTFARVSQPDPILGDLRRRSGAARYVIYPGNRWLITRRSQVQILPPLLERPRTRGLSVSCREIALTNFCRTFACEGGDGTRSGGLVRGALLISSKEAPLRAANPTRPARDTPPGRPRPAARRVAAGRQRPPPLRNLTSRTDWAMQQTLDGSGHIPNGGLDEKPLRHLRANDNGLLEATSGDRPFVASCGSHPRERGPLSPARDRVRCRARREIERRAPGRGVAESRDTCLVEPPDACGTGLH